MLRAMNAWLLCSEVCRRNYRPGKFVIFLRWLVDSCVLLSEAWRHVCRPTRCLLLRRQRSSVVCQLSSVDHCVYSWITSMPSTSRYYDRRNGRATAVLSSQRLIGSLLAAYQDSVCMSCLYLRDCVDWVDSVRTRRWLITVVTSP